MMIRTILNVCPETNEPQAVHAFRVIDNSVILETRGKTCAWRHTITTEEIDLPNAAMEPCGREPRSDTSPT